VDEIEAMKVIAEKMEPLSDSERARVLTWAAAKYSITVNVGSLPSASASPSSQSQPSAQPKNSQSAANGTKPKTSKKAKSIIAMDKSLNLTPPGKTSAADFASSKAPGNAMQKCVVAAYYLRDTIEMDSVTVSAVYTFFKTLGWPIPTDLKNTLQQAGTKGWLDTKDSEDIKLTSMGENLVEHSLPPKTKA